MKTQNRLFQKTIFRRRTFIIQFKNPDRYYPIRVFLYLNTSFFRKQNNNLYKQMRYLKALFNVVEKGRGEEGTWMGTLTILFSFCVELQAGGASRFCPRKGASQKVHGTYALAG